MISEDMYGLVLFSEEYQGVAIKPSFTRVPKDPTNQTTLSHWGVIAQHHLLYHYHLTRELYDNPLIFLPHHTICGQVIGIIENTH